MRNETQANMCCKKAIFILDIEVELAWGTIDKRVNARKVKEASKNVRKHLDSIIQLVEKHKIPVTWAIVGHLILDRCAGTSDFPHPEMPRPSYAWMKEDWYARDPCKSLADEPAFYGRDILDKIINYISKTQIPHDVACHAFSHQLFGDAGCSKEVAEAEIKRSIKLMQQIYSVRPVVFVFPRDYVGHLGILRENGFIAFRGEIPRVITYFESGVSKYNSMRKYISLTSYLLSFYSSLPPPVVTPHEMQGLVNIPGCMCYNDKAFIPLALITSKAKKGLKRAVKEKKIFHLYTHLINFGEVSDIKAFLKGFEDILAFADKLRNKNQLEIMTMRRLAEE